MKQPVFTLPNSLTILKKYKKQAGKNSLLIPSTLDGVNGRPESQSITNVLNNMDPKP